MNTVALIELVTMLIDMYFKHASLEGLTEEEATTRLNAALVEKLKRKAEDLPDV